MDEKESIGTVRKWFLDLWTDMCRALVKGEATIPVGAPVKVKDAEVK